VIQFHIEVRSDTVKQWGCIPEYKTALESSLGGDTLAKFDETAQANMTEMNGLAELLYSNFKKIV
jgi:hypothetical protein